MRGPYRVGPLADINMTPLVDVMMVLLIIVFVTAPLLTQGVEVDLPETRTVDVLPQDKDHLIVTIKKGSKIFIEEYEVTVDELAGRLETLAKRQGKSLFLQADREVPYGLVVKVMGEIKAAGIDKIGMVAEEDEKKG